MKSVAYVFMTVITMIFIGFGWEGGPNGQGYVHLAALLIGGFLTGCIYKTEREEIREEDGEKSDGHNFI